MLEPTGAVGVHISLEPGPVARCEDHRFHGESPWTRPGLVRTRRSWAGTDQTVLGWYGPDGPALVRTRRSWAGTDQTVLRWYGPDGPALVRTRRSCTGTDQTVLHWYGPDGPALVCRPLLCRQNTTKPSPIGIMTH
ncbi:hypothetical protein NHX12_007305 [Muraenolepis orangiensis]|uniref:Uncharacterized protein n=1 Tax=Muraenolepis orangiensis TaxID=630683 RepID=A0A9Q0DPR8_9TELE|nr:hypothetical protein NHX12_007305 [Muraenolepis orangiensis]